MGGRRERSQVKGLYLKERIGVNQSGKTTGGGHHQTQILPPSSLWQAEILHSVNTYSFLFPRHHPKQTEPVNQRQTDGWTIAQKVNIHQEEKEKAKKISCLGGLLSSSTGE